ncbi:MAG TPA: hypothetical protein VNS53_09970 [Sphingomicrobium sp.]|jgi:hypothetical protein|nr:hypothetical protein [Sphingomicrobium sp.]
MTRLLIGAVAGMLIASAAQAQVSYVSNNLPAKKGDPNRIVCEQEEAIGTRLGGKRICMTVEQWNEKHNEHREFTERIQSGTWGRESQVPSVWDSPATTVPPH